MAIRIPRKIFQNLETNSYLKIDIKRKNIKPHMLMFNEDLYYAR